MLGSLDVLYSVLIHKVTRWVLVHAVNQTELLLFVVYLKKPAGCLWINGEVWALLISICWLLSLKPALFSTIGSKKLVILCPKALLCCSYCLNVKIPKAEKPNLLHFVCFPVSWWRFMRNMKPSRGARLTQAWPRVLTTTSLSSRFSSQSREERLKSIPQHSSPVSNICVSV